MSQVQYAKHRGVGKSAVSNWKAKGLLVFGDPGDGNLLVDVARTDAKLNTALDPTRGRPTTVAMADAAPVADALPLQDPDSLGVVRTELLREQRIGHRIRNARDAGDLVAKAAYESRIAELGRMTRERIHGVIRAQAERLAAERDPRLIIGLMTGEIDRVFAELADQAEAGAFSMADADLEPGAAED